MLIRRPHPQDCARIAPSEITPHSVYLNRRELLRGAMAAGLIGTAWPHIGNAGETLQFKRNDAFSTKETPTTKENATTYNNFYEFGTDKQSPSENSGRFKPKPWSVKIAGEAEVTGDYAFEDLIKPYALEERVYRMRCVERWSMVIPWVGIPLGDVLKRFKPTSKAKYVAFKTVYRPKEMPGQDSTFFGGGLSWPYIEGLRIDEAMHPLTLLVVGLYGETLPNQNGAPLRLVTPWKYGFKGIKSIVEIRFVEKEPQTTWNIAAPHEYGFYANVNPN
ncbi:MAG TPA: protein-methionine-sulfoxide reductase catalytic subunit MsrP, partial [Steroidobacteraceae bacterium]|nr:protein-methionine-sulfoxide reductase catalytic subunit MsrP [Steroidobacteraceae bacterium]